jgi:ParB family chromosome partitioning protein
VNPVPQSDQKYYRANFSGNNEWYTPQKYIDAAKEVMQAIDLDPASSEQAQKIIKAKKYFTMERNGLNQQWRGRIWLNPPFSRELISLFIDKLIGGYKDGKIKEAILLTHNFTDTSWFHTAEQEAAALCFTRGRIKFIDEDGNHAQPTQGQCFFYYGDNAKKFEKVFSNYGFVR